MTLPDIVTYDGLPAASGGAHKLTTKKPSLAHAKVTAFLEACLIAQAPPSLSFRLWSAGDAAQRQHWQGVARDLLGGPRRAQTTHREWSVRPDSVAAVLQALDAADASATTPHGAPLAALVLSTDGALRDPDSGGAYLTASDSNEFVVDGYGRILGTSGVRATFGTTASSLSLWLCLPADQRLMPASAHLADHAPVRLSAKHWRRWTPTRDGTSYRSVRIGSPVTG